MSQTDQRTLKRNRQLVKHGGWNSKTLRQILISPRTSGHVVYKGTIVRRNVYEPILEEDIRQSLITLFADPARKTSPGNVPRWLGSLIYRCGVCRDGTTMSVRKNNSGTPVYRCRAKGHCQWPAERVDTFVAGVIVARLSRPDVTDLIPHGPEVDVAGLRDELIVCDARKRSAAQLFAQTKIDEAQLATITAELDQQMTTVRAALAEASGQSPLSEFAASEDAQHTWDQLTIGRKREVLRTLLVVTLPPLGRGNRFSRNLIHIKPATRAAA